MITFALDRVVLMLTNVVSIADRDSVTLSVIDLSDMLRSFLRMMISSVVLLRLFFTDFVVLCRYRIYLMPTTIRTATSDRTMMITIVNKFDRIIMGIIK